MEKPRYLYGYKIDLERLKGKLLDQNKYNDKSIPALVHMIEREAYKDIGLAYERDTEERMLVIVLQDSIDGAFQHTELQHLEDSTKWGRNMKQENLLVGPAIWERAD